MRTRLIWQVALCHNCNAQGCSIETRTMTLKGGLGASKSVYKAHDVPEKISLSSSISSQHNEPPFITSQSSHFSLSQESKHLKANPSENVYLYQPPHHRLLSCLLRSCQSRTSNRIPSRNPRTTSQPSGSQCLFRKYL